MIRELKIWCVSFLALTIIALNAQETIFPVAQEMPTIKGCETIADLQERHQCTQDKIRNMLAENLKYPDEAREAGEEGYAIVSFVVNAKGGIDELMVKEDPGFGMGEAAMKAVKKMSKHWVAGKNKGEAVSVRMNVPVSFRLPDEEPSEETAETPDVYTVVDQMPAFAGCDGKQGKEAQQCTFEKVTKYVLDNMKYPEEAKKAGVEGTVIASFVVDTEGNVINSAIKQGLGSGCDEEVLRLLSEMPVWMPGQHQGKAVKVQMTLPFRFRAGKS